MPAISMKTKSGGQIDFAIQNSGLHGNRLYLHIDQSYNVKNGEGEAAITLDVDECKSIIANLNDYIKYREGSDYVYTSKSVIDLISKPEIQKVLIELGYTKIDDLGY